MNEQVIARRLVALAEELIASPVGVDAFLKAMEKELQSRHGERVDELDITGNRIEGYLKPVPGSGQPYFVIETDGRKTWVEVEDVKFTDPKKAVKALMDWMDVLWEEADEDVRGS